MKKVKGVFYSVFEPNNPILRDLKIKEIKENI